MNKPEKLVRLYLVHYPTCKRTLLGLVSQLGFKANKDLVRKINKFVNDRLSPDNSNSEDSGIFKFSLTTEVVTLLDGPIEKPSDGDAISSAPFSVVMCPRMEPHCTMEHDE